MPLQKLSPDARRMRTIVVTLPLIGVTSYILYKRLVLREEQRRLPQHGPLLSVKTTMPPDSARAPASSRGAGAGAGGDSPPREKTP